MPLASFIQFFRNTPGEDPRPLLHRLRISVLVFYALTFAIAVLAVVWLSYEDYHETLRATERQAVSLARSLDEHAARSFVSVEQAMQNVAEDLERTHKLDSADERWLHERLKAKVELTPQIRAIVAIDSKGILRAHGLEFPTRQVDLSDRGYFAYHHDHPDQALHIGEPIISRTDYKWLIPLTRRLNNPDGSFGGVMLAGVDPAYYIGFYDSLKLERGTDVQVMRGDGLLLINYPLDITRLGENILGGRWQTGIAKIPPTSFFRETDSQGNDHFIAQLASGGAIPLIVRVCMDADRVLAPYLASTRLRIVTALLALGVLSLILFVLLRQIQRVEASEARLRLTQFTVDESPDMIVWSSTSGQIRYANRRLAEASGHSPEVLLTLNLGELIEGDSLSWLTHGERVGEAHGVESVLRKRDGDRIPVEFSVARIHDGQDGYLCITARDISERKAAQEELRQHRDHLQEMIAERTAEIRTVLDANPLAIILVVQRRIELVNPAFESLFGYDLRSVRQLPQESLHASPESFFTLRDELSKALKLGSTFRGETELRRRDGSTFWGTLFARAILPGEPERGLVCIVEDVSALRAAAQNLRQSERLKRSVLDAISDSFALIDDSRRFVDVNQALCLQLGLHRSVLIGQTPESVWGEALGRRLFPPLEALTPGSGQQEILLPVRSGQRHPFLVSYGAIPDESGRLAYRFAFLADISRQKQIANSLLEAKEAAEAANQAKSSFLTNMSHELRTPMHAILSFSEMGQLRSASDSDLNRYFERIQNAGQRLLALLNDLLDLSRLEADRMSYDKGMNSLQHTVLAAVSEVSSLTATRRISIETDADSPRIIAHFDRARITQVVINLLSNAIKFSPEGGVIHVDFVSDTTLPDGRAAVGLRVRDEGPGIPIEEIELIFESFVQGSQTQASGTGLGLAISQRIVRDHGGEISAANHADGGAVFTVLLPLEASEAITV